MTDRIPHKEIQLQGFPNAAKVISLDGPKSKRLADLALHIIDLEFADDCLDAINSENPPLIREALWRCAIVHVFKCFGDPGVRFQLSPEKILKGEPPEAMMGFEYFKSLRNKHLVHDENSYTLGLPGAVLNNPGATSKVQKVMCMAALSHTLEQANYGNLKLLIKKTREWVDKEFLSLAQILSTELEALPCEDLAKRPPMSFKVPEPADLHKRKPG